jgi:SAM-dependent methyltransferase
MEIGNFDPKDVISSQVEKHSSQKKKMWTIKRNKLRERDIDYIKKFFPNAKSILCVGARDDSEVKNFIKHGYNAIGIDIANESKFIKKIDIHKMDKYFKEDEFDLIYASHVLEHVYDFQKVFDNIKRIVKHGIIILLPLGWDHPKKDHIIIFEIMRIKKENPDIFKLPTKYEKIWNDFNSLNPYKILFGEFRKGINERETMFILKLEN